MKKLIVSMMAALFLASVSVPLLAAEATPGSTPVAKTMKHKRNHKKKASKKASKKKKAEASTTPMAK